MTDIGNLLQLISELTALLTAAQHLADMVIEHNSRIQRIGALTQQSPLFDPD
jgi:hypothetical protein